MEALVFILPRMGAEAGLAGDHGLDAAERRLARGGEVDVHHDEGRESPGQEGVQRSQQRQAAERRTYPQELMGEVAGLIVDPAHPPMDEFDAWVPWNTAERAEFLRVEKPIFGHAFSVIKYAHCNQRSYEEITLHLLGTRDQPDFMAVFLPQADGITKEVNVSRM